MTGDSPGRWPINSMLDREPSFEPHIHSHVFKKPEVRIGPSPPRAFRMEPTDLWWTWSLLDNLAAPVSRFVPVVELPLPLTLISRATCSYPLLATSAKNPSIALCQIQKPLPSSFRRSTPSTSAWPFFDVTTCSNDNLFPICQRVKWFRASGRNTCFGDPKYFLGLADANDMPVSAPARVLSLRISPRDSARSSVAI